MAEINIDPDRTLMLGIDWQVAFGTAIEVPQAVPALENALKALEHWRSMGKVVLTRHVYRTSEDVGRLEDFIPGVFDLLHIDSAAAELYSGVQQPGDTVIDKRRFNALLETDLDRMLDKDKIDTVVVHGLTTPICVQTTVDALMMSNRRVILLEDACASQAMNTVSPEVAHYNAVQRMGAMFAQVFSTQEFIERTS